MAEEQDMTLIFSKKHIKKKKKSTYRTIHTEHLPNGGRRPQTSEKGKKHSTQLGRTKGKVKREREKTNQGQD